VAVLNSGGTSVVEILRKGETLERTPGSVERHIRRKKYEIFIKASEESYIIWNSKNCMHAK
jgi:hypothetical protein